MRDGDSFKVVEADDKGEFEAEVNRLMASGWRFINGGFRQQVPRYYALMKRSGDPKIYRKGKP